MNKNETDKNGSFAFLPFFSDMLYAMGGGDANGVKEVSLCGRKEYRIGEDYENDEKEKAFMGSDISHFYACKCSQSHSYC